MKGVTNYLKNVTKSVAYAAQDIAKEDMIPNVSEFASSNKAFIASTYATIKNPKTALKRSVTAIQSSKVYQAIDYGVKNTFEDLRTGNFYNKAREERDELRLSGLGGSDDWDDLSDFDIDKDWESKIGKDSSDRSDVTDGDIKIVEAIEGSNAAASSATINAILSSSEAQIKNSRANVGMIYMQNEKLFGGLHSDLSVLNSTMDVMNKVISKSLPNMDKNMADYFTQDLKLSNERNAILKEMLEMQRNQYKSAMDKEKEAAAKKKQRASWSSISSSGMPEFDKYFEQVKKNIANEIGGLGMPAFSEDGNMLAAMFTSPLKGIVKTMVNGVIPATVKAATKELDSTITGIFGQIIGRLGNARRDGNGLFGILGRIFGINTGVDRSIDTSKYEKGPVPFDGITRKAIIDVIPSYLRRIEAHLTGSPEQTFDYALGKWTTLNSAKRKYDDIRKNSIQAGTSEIREFTKDAFATVTSSDAYQAAKIERAKAQFWEFMYANNGVFNPRKSAKANGIEVYQYPDLADETIFKALCQAYKKAGYAEVHTRGGVVTRDKGISIQMNAARNVLEAKERENAQYRELEKNTSTIIQYMSAMGVDSHGKWKNDKFAAKHNMLIDTRDRLGNTIFDYLRNINQEITWFRQYGYEDIYTALLSLGIGKKKKKHSSGHNGSINTADNRSQSFRNIDLRNSSYQDILQAEQAREDRRNNEKIRKAMRAISDNKAADLAGISHESDVAEYMMYLTNLMLEGNSQEFAEELREYDANAVAQFIESHIIRRNVKSISEYRQAQQRDERREAERESQQNKEKNFLSGIFDRIQKAGSIAGAAAGAFSDVITEALYTADKAIYDMMFRADVEDPEGDGNKYKGFMDMMAHKVNDTFDKIAKGFQDNFIKPFKQWLGIDDEWETRFKNKIYDMGHGLFNRFVGANRDVYGNLAAGARRTFDEGIEGIRRRSRAKHRGAAIRDIEHIEDTHNLYDHNFVQTLFSYGLNPADFETFDDAKAAIEKKITDYYIKNIAEGDSIESELRTGFRNASMRSRIYNRYSITDNGETADEFAARVGAVATRSEAGNVWASRSGRFSATSRNVIDEAAALGFVGDRAQKLIMLREMGVPIEVSKLSYYDDAALAKRFLNAKGATYIHAKGTMGNTFTGVTALSQNELLINNSGIGRVNKTGVYNITDPTAIVSSQDAYRLGYSKRRTTQRHDEDAEKIAVNKYMKGIPGHASGTIKITNNNALFNPDEIMSEAKKFIPEAAAGGLVGGVLSMLLGIVGGPLIGGAVGAGASIISSSDVLKEKLFGKIVDGERDGTGIINSSIVNTVKKYAPGAIKGGLAGVIPGLLTPLGPLGGMVVGAGISILKNNESFKEKYFGEDGPLKITQKEKDILEKLMPGVAKGAAAGAVATLFGGPFGLLGNAAVGAGIGLMASSDEFKDLLFGAKVDGVRSGGVLGAITDAFEPLKKAGKSLGERIINTLENNVVKPLSEFVVPFIHELPRIAGALPRGLRRLMDSKYGRAVGGFAGRTVGRLTGGIANVGSKVIGAGVNLATSPIRLLGAVGSGIRAGQIRRHDADYMTAAERIDWNTKHGYVSQDYDRALAGIGMDDENALTMDDARKIQELAYLRMDSESALNRKQRASSREISGILNRFDMNGVKLSSKAKKAVMNAVRSGKTEDIPKILTKYKMSDGNKISEDMLDMLMNGEYGLSDSLKSHAKINARLNTLTSTSQGEMATRTQEIQNLLASKGITGIDFNNKDSLMRLVRNIDTELANREANGAGVNNDRMIELPNITGRIEDNTASIISLLQAQIRLTAAVTSGDQSEVALAAKEAGTAIDNANAKIQANLHQDVNKAASLVQNVSEINNERLEALRKFDRTLTRAPGLGGAIRAARNRAKFVEAEKVLTSEEYTTAIKLANGDINSLNRLTTIKKRIKCELSKEVMESILTLSRTQYNHIRKCMNDTFARFLDGKPITREDIQFLVTVNEKEFKNVMKDHVVRRKLTYSSFKSLKEAFNNIRDTSQPAHNFLGSLVSGALGLAGSAIKGIGSLAFNGVKAIGRGAKNLISGASDKIRGVSPLSGGAISRVASGIGGGNFNETDRAGDNRDIIQYGPNGDPIAVKKGSDGSIEPDTSDSKTKSVIDKITMREKLAEKAEIAQDKIHGLLDRVFNPPEAKKKGFNWLTALLFGGALLKSGVLGKFFSWLTAEDGPLDRFGKWFTGENGPWEKFKGWWGETAWPWITNTLSRAISSTLGNANFWKGLVKTAGNIGAVILDTVTGNKTNVGAVTETSAAKMSDNRFTDVTGAEMDYMVDADGNVIYSDTIGNYVGQTVYNPEGAAGVVQSDGTVKFKDQSRRGSSFAKVTANAAVHALAQGSSGIGMRAISVADKAFTKGVSKVPLVGKVLNGAEKAVTFVPKQTGKLGSAIADRVTSRSSKKAIESAAKSGASYIPQAVAVNGVEVAAKEVAEESAEHAVKEAAEQVVKQGAKEATEQASKTSVKTVVKTLVDKIDGMVAKAFSDSKIVAKLKSLFQYINGSPAGQQVERFSNWVSGLKSKISKVFTRGATECAESSTKGAGKQSVKNAGKSLSVAVSWIFFITDFLTGMDRAEMLLGVTDTNIIVEFFAGLANAVCNWTIVLAIFPGVNWFCEKLISPLMSDYEARVAAADKEYQDYIDSTGSTMTKEEYLESKYSYTGKVKHTAKEIYKETKNTTEEYIDNWVVGADSIKDGVKNFGDSWKTGMQDIKSKISDFGTNWKTGMDTIGQGLTNAKNSLSDKFTDFKDSWATGVDDLSSKIGNLATKISEPFTNLGNKIESGVDKFNKKLESLGEKAYDTVEKGKKKAKKVGSSIKAGASDFADSWSTGMNDIANFFGFGAGPKPLSRYGTGISSANLSGSFATKLANKISTGVKDRVTSSVSDLKRKFSKSNLARLSFVPMKLGKNAVDALGLGIQEISEYARIRFNEMGIGGFFEDPATYIMSLIAATSANNTRNTTSTSTTKKQQTFASKIASGVTKVSNWLFGNGKYGRGFSKQIDPSVAGVRYNSSADSSYQTIGDSGCGPAAAVNAIEAFGRGNDVLTAANYALSHGYKETDGGTKPQFFTDYFNNNGYGAKYTSNKNSLADNIRAGMPTVLMGSDPNGVSDHTPYGTSPHYVTVTGMNNGYAVVQDPESMYDNQLYPMNELLNKSDFGVSAYGMGKNKYRAARVSRGRARIPSDTQFGMGKYGSGKQYILFVGDSRTVGMQLAVDPMKTNKKNIWYAKSGAGFPWLASAAITNSINAASASAKGKLAIVCLMGVNGLEYMNIATYLNYHAKTWVDEDGNELYFVSVNPVNESKEASHGYSVKNSQIINFNTNIKNRLTRNIKYIDTYNSIKGSFNTTDGLHYTNDTYKEIYNLIKNAVGKSSTTAVSDGTTTSTSVSTTSSSSSSSSSEESTTIGGFLAGVLANSKIGQVVNSFLSIGDSSKSSSSSSSSSASTSSGSTDASVVKGTDARSITWNYLAKQGFSKAAIAGTMGNMEGEVAKNYNKNIFPGDNNYVSTAEWEYGQYKSDDNVYDNGGGIIQWTPWKEKIGKYSKEKYGDIHAWTKSLPMQLEYLLSYIPGVIGNGSAYSLTGAGLSRNLVSSLDEFKKMTDVEQATRQWQAGVERPLNSVAHTDRRIGAAKWYYKNMENIKKAASGKGKYGRGKYGRGSQYEKAVGKVLADFSSKGYQSGLSRGQCTWYAEGRAYEKCGWPGVWNQPRGNGNQIYAFAVRDGYDAGPDIAPNSLVSMNSSSQYGHVMFVEDVDIPNKKIYYAEANSDGTGHAPDDGVIKVKSFSDWNKQAILGYVYAGEDKTGTKINDDGTTSSTEEEEPSGTTIGQFLSKVLSESKAGQALSKFTDLSTSSNKVFTLEGMNTSATLKGSGRGKGSAMDSYKRQRQAMADANKYKLHINDDGTTTVRDRRTGKVIGKTAGFKGKAGKGAGNKPMAKYGMATGTNVDQSVLINTIVSILMKIAENTDKLNTIVSILNSKLGMNISAADINSNTGSTESLKSRLRNSLNSAILSQGADVSNARDSINNASMNSIISAMNALASE